MNLLPMVKESELIEIFLHFEDRMCTTEKFQLTATLWKLFKILSYEILDAKFGFGNHNLV